MVGQIRGRHKADRVSPPGPTRPHGVAGEVVRCASMPERITSRRSFPYAVWCGITSVLLVLQHLSARVLREPGYSWLPPRGLTYYLDGWSQFDGPEYIKIAEQGYWYTPGVRSPVVWFPVYPMLLRGMQRLIDDPLLAGMVVASIGGLAAVGLYWRWLLRQGMDGTTRTVAFLFLLTYPYAWYLYGVVHSDAVFLALVIGAFLLVEDDRPVLAGVVGAFATATRPTGLAVIPALVFLTLERGGVLVPLRAPGSGRLRPLLHRWAVPVSLDRSAFRPSMLGPLLACCGVGAYMTYLGVRFGDPMAFRTNQTVYHPSELPLLKRAFVGRWLEVGDDPTYTLTITGQAIVAAVVLCSTPFVGRRFGWGYGLFTAVLVAIPSASTADFMGTGRYMIAAFPVAALLGEWLSRQAYRWVWIASSGAVMALLSMGFARSWYLT